MRAARRALSLLPKLCGEAGKDVEVGSGDGRSCAEEHALKVAADDFGRRHLLRVARHREPLERRLERGRVPWAARLVHLLPRLHLAHRFEVGRLLRLAHGLEQHVLDRHRHVRPGEALRALAEHLKVGGRERVGRVADVHLEHVHARALVGERDVDALVEAPPDRLVEIVRCVGRREHQHLLPVVPHALHLYQNLCLDAPRSLALPRLPPRPAQRINLVDEDD
mmetsp:Transcript_29112/g.95032  ORF Transcript_29112/g.95032 Transcript_29112/m.95032 type:complete len:223 (+) Transcript_29112:73-741(+)